MDVDGLLDDVASHGLSENAANAAHAFNIGGLRIRDYVSILGYRFAV